MAIDDQEEYEQGEQVRNWLRSNGGSMIGGIAVGLALIAGWQWWQRKQEVHSQDAATSYAILSDSVRANTDEKRLAKIANALRTDYANTPYATLAALRVAAHQVDRGDAKGALATLDAVGKVSDPALATLVRLRAARLLVALGRPADALTRIGPTSAPVDAPVADEIRGDAERALGHTDAARAAYANALKQMPAAAPNREILEMKLADLGGVAPKPEAKKA
ncbi:MAG TPA: tetratricopeptide repeat protein [Xanthomonadaceae bacterium]|nr:tetratricopeptide repeat protein [Xanthomonadaceae bacterium]